MDRTLEVVFGCLVTFGLIGCAMSAHEVRHPLPMPRGWELLSQVNPDSCLPIDAVYENVGTGTFGHQPRMTVARLDAALGRALPPPRQPKRVAVSFDPRNKTLRIQYLGSEPPYEYSVSVECEEGWLSWNSTLRDQYLADGISLEESSEQTRLRESSDFDLIVHSRGEAVYSSAIVVRDREVTEWWAKFPRVDQ